MKINVDGERLPQGPRAAIIESAALLVPGGRPGFPPLATMYTSEDGDGQVYAPEMLKPPFASEVGAGESRGVDAEPSPVVPTA